VSPGLLSAFRGVNMVSRFILSSNSSSYFLIRLLRIIDLVLIILYGSMDRSVS